MMETYFHFRVPSVFLALIIFRGRATTKSPMYLLRAPLMFGIPSGSGPHASLLKQGRPTAQAMLLQRTSFSIHRMMLALPIRGQPNLSCQSISFFARLPGAFLRGKMRDEVEQLRDFRLPATASSGQFDGRRAHFRSFFSSQPDCRRIT